MGPLAFISLRSAPVSRTYYQHERDRDKARWTKLSSP